MAPISIEKKQELCKIIGTFYMLKFYIENRKALLSFTMKYGIENKLFKQSRRLLPKKPRMTWSVFSAKLSDEKFRRMYRMTRECFQQLCLKIETAVGKEEFRSEDYLKVRDNYPDQKLYYANKKRFDGYISGEVKLAITLRLLAGASYLDLEVIFKVPNHTIYRIFHQVLTQWICNEKVVQIDFYKNGTDTEAMKETTKSFAQGTSNGIIGGCIGAIDGLLIKMVAPSKKRDNVKNISNFYSRKGYYAINTQVIVDKQKRVLWFSIKCKGSEHDSTAFKVTSLYKDLVDSHQSYIDHGFYLIGDCAYAQRPFLITPYDNAQPGSKQDAFNFHLSSCRIYVECAFGEMYKRWGILWRPLSFKLNNSIRIIESIFRLHNFIIQFELDNNIRTFNQNDHNYMSEEMLRQISVNISDFLGYFDDEQIMPNEKKNRDSKHDKKDKELFNLGKELREKICNAIESDGLRRPKTNIRRDEFNIVYCDE